MMADEGSRSLSAPARDPDPVDVRVVMAVVMVGTFLAPLDGSIVNVALPRISEQLGAPLTSVQWVATAYLLTNATLVLTMGRLGDLWGLKRVYAAGFAVFGLGSLACAFAPGLAALVGARVAQGVGAAMMFAIGPAIVAAAVPPERRGWALGLVSLAVALGLTLGPPLGGLLTTQFGWRAIFLINVPLAAVVAPVALHVLPEDHPRKTSFDAAGAALVGAALLSLLLALSLMDQLPDSWPMVAGAASLGVLLAFALVLHERRRTDPMLDMRLLGSRGFGLPVLAALLAFTALSAAVFAMPFYLTRIRGLQEQEAGFVLVALPLAMALLSPLFGRLSDSWGTRGIATGGLAVLAGGLVLLSFSGPDTPLALIAGGLFVAGLGIAMFQPSNTSEILGATPKDRLGVGSAIVGEARTVGQSVGIAAAAAVLGSVALPLGTPGPLTRADALAFTSAMSGAFWAAAGVAALGALLSWRSSR
jgi:EmrB/QacA subfamily drug resistance transporter